MTTATLPLQEFVHRIAQQEAELARLRREFETRQAQLADLGRRKQVLQAELQKVEAAIQTVATVDVPATKPVQPAAPSKTFKGAAERVSLPKLLISIVEQTVGPVSTKALTEAVVQHNYPTNSKDLYGMVDTRVSELVRKKIFKRAGDRSGVVLHRKPAAAKPAMTKAAGGAASNGHNKALGVGPATSSAKKMSLKEALTKVLAKSPRPMGAGELATKVLEGGYQTKSKDFKNVIWVATGNMDNVEHVSGEGYRLKRGKTTAGK